MSRPVKTFTRVIAVTVLAAFIFSRPMGASASPSMDQRAKEDGMEFQKGYAPVDGLSMYYEIHGSAHADRPPWCSYMAAAILFRLLSAN